MIYIWLKRLRIILIVIATSLFVASCGTSLSGNNYCNIASPILLEEGDVNAISDNLAKDLLIHNTVYEKLCDA
tara:strand:- start:323 stop:541 length:219 start_codon:yes stop_codon:yes gene_type:complete